MQSQMKLQLDILKSVFETRYALNEWKKEHFNFSLEEEVGKAKDAVDELKNPTVKQFQHIVKRLFNSFRDYHMDVFFYSTEEAELPFKVKPVHNKYLIAYIDTKKLSPDEYPLAIGDEILLWDDKPVSDFVDKIKHSYFCGGNPLTDNALASQALTHRKGMLGHEIFRGEVSITVRHYLTQKVASYLIPWENTPERITYRKGLDEQLFSKKSILPCYEGVKDFHTSFESIGGRKGFVPELGPLRWVAGKEYPFHTYLFELPDNKLGGYIRISHFRGNASDVAYFEKLIEFYEQYADALVLDVTNNPGGSPLYADALAAMLSPKPLIKPGHKLSLTHHEAAMAATTLPLLEKAQSVPEVQKIIGLTRDGYPVNMETRRFLIDYLRFVENEWNAGKWISDPFPIYGIRAIPPHSIIYTKPILVLTNCLSFSAADFLPALLQDNQRAVIFGERTAGAGGMFQTLSHINPFGIRSYHITISMGIRDNLQPIENLGVTPDVLYSLTDHDLQCQYKTYKKYVTKILDELIHGTYTPH